MREVLIEEDSSGNREGCNSTKPLAIVVFPGVKSRSLSVTSRVIPTGSGEDKVREKIFTNGDIYIGGLSNGVPNGFGKYLWSDGCMFEGKWSRGKASGNGKFSWPSGSTFQGGFKAGRIEGFGTFIGSDGSFYKGSWSFDRKHGFGQKRYSNGDFYEGVWKKNLREGYGKYFWKNGYRYIGEWKNGVISGKGSLRLPNGVKYYGRWENSVLKDHGIFICPDGNSHVVNFGKDFLKHGQVFGFDFTLNTTEENEGFEKGSKGILPRICIWDFDDEGGDITCDVVDAVEAHEFYKNNNFEKFIFTRGNGMFRSPRFRGELKKAGEIVSKGHKNYELMLNIQLGIRYSVGKTSGFLVTDISPSDFCPTGSHWTKFPPEGSKVTPPHQSIEFKWKDYCPIVFRHLRQLFAVDTAAYMLAISGEDGLRELSSPGKSGSFFYLTQDDRFMIKTVRKSEVKVLLKMLPRYYHHVSVNETSILTRFFGVHCIKPLGRPKVHFVVMGNFFCSDYGIHRQFDLKGSSHGRTTCKLEKEIDENTTLKDLDLNFVFHLQKFWFQQFLGQIERDCEFLEAAGIMDYSLLVGVHFCDDHSVEKPNMASCTMTSKKWEYRQGHEDTLQCPVFYSHPHQSYLGKVSDSKQLIGFGLNMPARAEQVSRPSDKVGRGQANVVESILSGNGDVYEVILYLGIIDILQDYDVTKKLEHAYKSLQVDPVSISAVEPKLYSRRFRDFILRIFCNDG